MKIIELKQNRKTLIEKARTIIDEAEKREDPNLTAEENTHYDNLMKDIDKLSERIKREESLIELERAKIEKEAEREDQDKSEKRVIPTNSKEYREIYNKFLTIPNYTPSIDELRALQVDNDTAGGYMTPPQQFVNDLIQEKDNMVFLRRFAKTYRVPNADSLGAPSLDNDPADPTWTSEISIGSEDSTMSFGKRELRPHPLAQYIKVSNTLIRKVNSAEELVRERLGYKISVVEEAAFMEGSGSGRPLGVFTASDMGISTSRDVSTGNTTTEIRTDGLIEAKMSLKKQYRQNCVWIFHRDAVKQIMKLKDGEGRYIWQASITAGEPDRLLNYPVNESEYAPSTFTTGLYVGILGDFKYYWIVDALNMTIQKLVELYAGSNQTGFISRTETDGMPVLESAFARVKLA